MTRLWYIVGAVLLCACVILGTQEEDGPRVARIIGGTDVEHGQWPWLVSIQGKIPKFRIPILGIGVFRTTIYCGASLLSDRWLLTAAHCFSDEGIGPNGIVPKYWHAKLGDIELTDGLIDKLKGIFGGVLGIQSWKRYYIHADKIIIHPNYDSRNLWEHDIALVRLREAVPSGDDVPEIYPVDLPESSWRDFPQTGQRCIMKGWGCTEGGGSVSSSAQKVTLPIVSDEDCRRMWGFRTDMTTRVCAGHSLRNAGICPGDSGGPLVCDHEGDWVQVGIASFTSARRPGDVPGAFTRVTHYVDWIKAIMRIHS